MSNFKPLDVFQYPRVGKEITEDSQYWKKLGFPVACKEYGAIDHIDLTLQEPRTIAVTCSSKVQLYKALDNKVHSTLSRFKKAAYGGVFRKDGRLLAAGSEDCFVRLFEVQSGRPLRIFKGHTLPVHRCKFTKNGTHVISFSDDKSVGLWDIPTETRLFHIQDHQDYVRAGVASEASQDIFLSGSYDHTVKMYDARSASCILTVDHGSPVESVLMFPTGGIFLSAGGNTMKVWDNIAGRLLAQISRHHKTITSLCFASDGRRIMSASLDRHVKIYDVVTYEVVHTLDYPSPVLSIAAAPEDKIVVAGMTDGLLSIRHQKQPKEISKEERNNSKKVHYQYRYYGTDFKQDEVDVIVPEYKRQNLQRYDKYLKKFESSRALDAVLKDYVRCKNPEIAISVLKELIRRGTIKSAMAGREGETLLPIIKFVNKYIKDPRFARVLIDIGLMLTEIYGPKLNDPITRAMFAPLVETVKQEVQYLHEMMEVQGVIQGILAVAHSNSGLNECNSELNDVMELQEKSVQK